MTTKPRLSPNGLPLMSEREGESALVGAVEFASVLAAEKFMDWKLSQSLTLRLHHDRSPIVVEFEP